MPVRPRREIDIKKRVAADVRKCGACRRKFPRPECYSASQWAKRKYCSEACGRSKFSDRQKKMWERPGYRENIVECLTGRPSTQKGQKRPQFSGSGNHAWKGENAGYVPKHSWVRRHKVKPETCEECGISGKKLQWSNKDHKYRRVLEDYRALCVVCHRAYDKRMGNEERNP